MTGEATLKELAEQLASVKVTVTWVNIVASMLLGCKIQELWTMWKRGSK